MTDKEAFTPRSRPITAGKVIVWGALGVLLYVAHVAFIPLALALLFGLVLSSTRYRQAAGTPYSNSGKFIPSVTTRNSPHLSIGSIASMRCHINLFLPTER
jgi:hypothetical protein